MDCHVCHIHVCHNVIHGCSFGSLNFTEELDAWVEQDLMTPKMKKALDKEAKKAERKRKADEKKEEKEENKRQRAEKRRQKQAEDEKKKAEKKAGKDTDDSSMITHLPQPLLSCEFQSLLRQDGQILLIGNQPQGNQKENNSDHSDYHQNNGHGNERGVRIALTAPDQLVEAGFVERVEDFVASLPVGLVEVEAEKSEKGIENWKSKIFERYLKNI